MTSSSPGPREDPNYELRRLRARVRELEDVRLAAKNVCRYHDGTPGQAAQIPLLRKALALVPANEEQGGS